MRKKVIMLNSSVTSHNSYNRGIAERECMLYCCQVTIALLQRVEPEEKTINPALRYDRASSFSLPTFASFSRPSHPEGTGKICPAMSI